MTKMQLPSLHLANKNSYIDLVRHTRPGNLVGYWPLNETSGSIAHDVSGNGNHGTIYGALLGQPGMGDGNTSFYFDGINDTVDIFSSSLANKYNPSSTTILCHHKLDANVLRTTDGRRPYQFGKDYGPPYTLSYRSSTGNFMLYGHGTTGLDHNTILDGSNFSTTITSDYIRSYKFLYLDSLSSWACVIISDNLTTTYSQINNFLTLNRIVISTPTTEKINKAAIGSRNNADLFWKGHICHFALWNTTLSPTEMNMLGPNWRQYV